LFWAWVCFSFAAVWKVFQRWWADGPPMLGTPPTYGQLRRFCRWQARQLRRLARTADDAAAQRAHEQATWIVSVLRHHPLLDDLRRTMQQSASLLRELAPDRLARDHHEAT
jgi:hypothetical protein